MTIQQNQLHISKAEDFLPKLDSQSIQMIYIDPPYNTKSKQFEYNDSFTDDDWEKMMSNVLTQSQRILKETGCIFVSIDDNSLIELRTIMNKIFGKHNFLGMFITKQANRSNAKQINTIHEYVVAYAKDKKQCHEFKIKRIDIPEYKSLIENLCSKVKQLILKENKDIALKYLKDFIKQNNHLTWLKNYNQIDENGNIYSTKDLSTPSKPHELNIYEIGLYLPKLKTRGWQSKEKFIELYQQNKLVFKNDRPYEKHLLIDSEDNVQSVGELLDCYSRQGKHDLDKLNMAELFSTAKPVGLIKYLVKIATKDNDVIIDYFAGSGTTAQAVIEANNDDGHNRKFVLCQKDESITIAKENHKLAEFNINKIHDITKLRLEKLKELHKHNFNYVYEVLE